MIESSSEAFWCISINQGYLKETMNLAVFKWCKSGQLGCWSLIQGKSLVNWTFCGFLSYHKKSYSHRETDESYQEKLTFIRPKASYSKVFAFIFNYCSALFSLLDSDKDSRSASNVKW